MKLKKLDNRPGTHKYKKVLIFIGVTGGVIEALEKNLNVIHIVEDHHLDLYSNEIWRNIINIRLFNNVYVYKLRKKGQMIKFGENNTSYFN